MWIAFDYTYFYLLFSMIMTYMALSLKTRCLHTIWRSGYANHWRLLCQRMRQLLWPIQLQSWNGWQQRLLWGYHYFEWKSVWLCNRVSPLLLIEHVASMITKNIPNKLFVLKHVSIKTALQAIQWARIWLWKPQKSSKLQGCHIEY